MNKTKDFIKIKKENDIVKLNIYIGNLKQEFNITEELLDVQVFPYKLDISELTDAKAEDYADLKIREFINKEIAYWIDIFDNRPKNRDLESDTIAQKFARIEIERLKDKFKILSNKDKK